MKKVAWGIAFYMLSSLIILLIIALTLLPLSLLSGNLL